MRGVKMKKIFKIVLGIVTFIFISYFVAVLIRGEVMHSAYGFVKVTDKQIIEKNIFADEYQMEIQLGDEEGRITMNKSDELTYEADNSSSVEYEVQIEEIWDELEPNNWYFMRLEKKGFFGSNFEIVYHNPNLTYSE